MPVALNTADALYPALSRLYVVDDDNAPKELKAGATVTPHTNVLTPATGSTSSPVGRSFRTGGTSVAGPAVYGLDVAEYAASNAGAVSVFISFNQINSAFATSGRAACAAGADTVGIKCGVGWLYDPATGRFSPNNNNGAVLPSALTMTAGSLTASGVKSLAFTRNGTGVVKAYINGILDSNFTGGVSNSGSAFGGAWADAKVGLIGGMAANSWVSADYVHWAEFVGAELTEADMLRLHNSLTGANAFALLTLPADSTAPTLTGPVGTGGSVSCSGSVSTDETSGTLYAVATASATAPTAVQVEAGQDHTGAAALRVVSQAVTATGTQTIASGSCTAGTRYLHFMHKDAAGNRSIVVSSASFTVAAAGDTTDPVLTGSVTVPPETRTSTGFQADWPAATDNVAVASYDISTDGGATWPISWGTNNYTFVGLAPSTTYQLRVRARDTSGRLSAVISGTGTTLAATTYSLTLGPFALNTGSGPLLSTAISYTLWPGVDAGAVSGTPINGTGTTHATTGALLITGLASAGTYMAIAKNADGSGRWHGIVGTA